MPPDDLCFIRRYRYDTLTTADDRGHAAAWLGTRHPAGLYPGCPWQNGKEEWFNGTVRDECLNMHVFASAIEASVRLSAFRHHYNEERPHSALGYQTPSEFKRTWVAAQQKSDDPNIAT